MIDLSSPRLAIYEKAPHFAELFLWNVRSLSREFTCLSREFSGAEIVYEDAHVDEDAGLYCVDKNADFRICV